MKLASICEKSSEEARDRADVLGICIADSYAKVSCYKSGVDITCIAYGAGHVPELLIVRRYLKNNSNFGPT